jgi:hypothetical protein
MSRRFSGRREVAIGIAVYGVYLLVRRAALRPDGNAKAMRNAERIAAYERRLGLDLEPRVQGACVGRRRFSLLLNWAYVTLNVVLTVGSLARLFRRRAPEFHRFRRAAVLTTLAAQPLHLLLPTAPPRKLDGYVDTIAEYGGIDVDSQLVLRLYNPVAAMPSIHVAYAIVTAAGIGATADARLVRAAALAYPCAVTGTVLATGNHFTLDCLVGAGLAFAGLEASRRLDA